MGTDNGIIADDTIVEAVKRFNAGYNNTEHSVRSRESLGRGEVCVVVFKGQDQRFHENYVAIVKGKVFVYHTLPQLLRDRNASILDMTADRDRHIVYALMAMAFIMLAVVLGLAVFDEDNKTLQVLTGLFGILTGYLVGKRGQDQPSAP